jgi:hypothetical protein
LIRFRRSTFALLVLPSVIQALVACAPLVPARLPLYIRNTPGAVVVVTDKQFDAGLFRLEFPRTWSVVKASPADVDHIHVIFSAPDGGAISLTQVVSMDSPADEHIILQNGIIIKVSVEPAAAPSPSFLAQSEQLLASISG